MAYYVEAHFNVNANCIIPGYWQPEGTEQTMPCDTQEEAEALERALRDE